MSDLARTATAQTTHPSQSPPPSGLLQRQCACGQHTAAGGECAACRQKRQGALQRSLSGLAINRPGDRYEQEAERVAAAVLSGGELPGRTLSSAPALRRDGPPAAPSPRDPSADERRKYPGASLPDLGFNEPKNDQHVQQPSEKTETNEDRLGAAGEKLAETFLETALGKQLTDQAEKFGEGFISTLPGFAVSLSIAASTVATMALRNEEFPLKGLVIKLPQIAPGLKVKLTYKGPLSAPTEAGISFAYEPEAAKKPQASDTDRTRADIERIEADQAKFKEGKKTPAERAAEKRELNAITGGLLSRPGNILGIPGYPPRRRDDGLLQRDANGNDDLAVAPPIVHDVLSSPGQPLDPATRSFMEPRFGHNFSGVRVHTDGRAAASARDVSANAYTVGRNVVFGAGRFAPETHEGRRLIAHELTHVVQQSGSSGIRAGQTNDKHDRRPIDRNHLASLAREADPDREWQAACVRRLGGCSNYKDGGIASVEEIKTYNLECRKETGYPDNVAPSPDECKTAKERSNAPLSYELADAPISSDPKVRVERWLRNHRPEIEAAETRFKVDRRAIAGAVAWEAIENVRGAWTPSSVGPGKVHIYKDLAKGNFFDEDTVAKQVEDTGYLPKQDLEGRKNALRTSSGAILYIAAIMKAGADIAIAEGGFEIALNPEVLTWYYNSKDLPGWRALIKVKQRGTPFDTSQNPMSVWVKANLALLEAAVGKPSFGPTAQSDSKLQKAPLDDNELTAQTDPLEREASATAKQVINNTDTPASSETVPAVDSSTTSSVSTSEPDTAAARAVDVTPAIPSSPKPSFARDPGCVEAPISPMVPTPLPFTPDPTAPLPAKELAPDLSVIPSSQPWWGDAAAQSFGEKLAQCYASRIAGSGKPIDGFWTSAGLQVDFDRVVQGSFGRSNKLGTWFGIGSVLARILQGQRSKVTSDENKADAKLPKDKRRSADDLNKAVELRMQQERHNLVEDVRIQVALGTWAWMAERREKLDFDTIKQASCGKPAVLPELLTDVEIRAIVHGILVTKKQELTANDIERVTTIAQTAKDAGARRAKAATTSLTEDEKTAVIAKAELDRVKKSWAGELRRALIEARTTKDEANLVVPTRADIKGWNPDAKGTRIHKDIVALMKVLEGKFPRGFSAGTYQVNIEGDHASGGFEGRFRSLDMYPNGGPSRSQKPFGEIGFFDKQLAFDFALAIDQAVSGRGTYQILYNDFEVAREVNKVLKNGKMMNVDNVNDKAGHPANLNWHGPLVTHFHVDFAI